MKNMRTQAAYPLFIKDPYFSIWTTGEETNRIQPTFWASSEKPMHAYVEFDGMPYTFLGKGDCNLEQVAISTKGFITKAEYECKAFNLCVEYISPLIPTDLELLSCPVCYLKYHLEAKTAYKKAKIVFAVEERIAYANEKEPDRKERVNASVFDFEQFESAYLGLARQLPLSTLRDATSADWGFWYVCGENCYVQRGERTFIVAENKQIEDGFFLLGFDDIASVDYFGRILSGYYFRKGKNIADALLYSWQNQAEVYQKCLDFCTDLDTKLKDFPQEYQMICHAALAQSIAAHKLVYDPCTDKILFLSKECGSGGCTATLDVTYPSAPLFLLFNTELLKGMIYPIFEFASMPIWDYPFAPHDIGLYPNCYGQYYALKNDGNKYVEGVNEWVKEVYTLPKVFVAKHNRDYYDPLRQMPAEECSNMLILIYMLYQADHDTSLMIKEAETLKGWADYLLEHGKEPGDQLCTDDFCGRKDKNINLSIKAAVALKSYAEICKILGEDSHVYENGAKEIAEFIEKFGTSKKHLPATFNDTDDTFSLKYNLVVDLLFDFGLFSKEIYEKEVSCYLKNVKHYGIPLYSDIDSTKSDWLTYVACFSDDVTYQKKIYETIVNSMKEATHRLPFSDWYSVEDGNPIRDEFRNRSVQAGVFMPMLYKEYKNIQHKK